MSYIMYCVEILIILAILSLRLIRSKKSTSDLADKLPGPKTYPIFGNALMFWCKDEDIFQKITDCIEKYASPMRFWNGTKLYIIFSKANQVEKIFASTAFSTKDDIYKFIKYYNGEGLISGSGPKWKKDRRLMSPLFLKRNILQYFPVILKHTKILVNILEEKINLPTFDIEFYICKAGTDFVNESLLGLKSNNQGGKNDEFLIQIRRYWAVTHGRGCLNTYTCIHQRANNNVHGAFVQTLAQNCSLAILATVFRVCIQNCTFKNATIFCIHIKAVTHGRGCLKTCTHIHERANKNINVYAKYRRVFECAILYAHSEYCSKNSKTAVLCERLYKGAMHVVVCTLMYARICIKSSTSVCNRPNSNFFKLIILPVHLFYFRAYELIHKRIIKPWLQIDSLYGYSYSYLKQKEAQDVIHGFFYKVLIETKKSHRHLGQKDISFRTILEQLLDIRDEIADFATDEEIIHHLVTLYSASEHTVTNTCSFTLVLLGMYPDYQQKVAEEIRNVVGFTDDIQEQHLDKLDYLEMVIKEVLRLFPIVPFIVRQANQETELDKLSIPNVSSVMVSIYNIHRDPSQWEKPNNFYPEHFLPQAIKNRHPYAYVPFSAGLRGCIGKPFAYMAIKILLVSVLQKYIIEADGNLQERKLTADFSVKFKDKIFPLRIKNRV
ncbi:unnamed protein product [Ceutorhynchus assimilis]|uniref:Cytochrome P450 n=1 Tax=Ceutorhynchus assimilis TaxID=467358 RepID=A0A9P0DJA8_9CUCU|nr:unnamed protein product [Ceutorhynchus assimilis]